MVTSNYKISVLAKSIFQNVRHHQTTPQMGDLGSKVLPPVLQDEVANWTAGSTPRSSSSSPPSLQPYPANHDHKHQKKHVEEVLGRVAWGMRFNHGGGYQYRLCPLEKMPCTEEQFQEMPLQFVRDEQAIVSLSILSSGVLESKLDMLQMWNNGTLHPIKGMFVDDSVCPVVPKGSTWARNPVPRIHTDNIGMAFVGGCWGQNGPPGEVR